MRTIEEDELDRLRAISDLKSAPSENGEELYTLVYRSAVMDQLAELRTLRQRVVELSRCINDANLIVTNLISSEDEELTRIGRTRIALLEMWQNHARSLLTPSEKGA